MCSRAVSRVPAVGAAIHAVGMNKLAKTVDETQEPVPTTVKGSIPKWIEGSLYRNGPGMFEMGEHKLRHFFDGMAMIQRFHISGGEVTYQRRFLPTENYKRGTEAKTTLFREFGTPFIPDPCLNVFQRFLSHFKPGKITDNTLVSLFPYNKQLYATTESTYINRVDQTNLDKIEMVDLMERADLFISAAHPHWDSDGRVHYVGHNFTGRPKTTIVTFPPGTEETPTLPKATKVCDIPSPWKIHISYYHSFGLTENYFILVDQSFMFNVMKLALPPAARITPSDALQFFPDTPVRFRIIDRKTGEQVNSHVTYRADAFLLFHHINAYEEDGHVVLDVACHEDRRIVDFYYMKELTSEQWQEVLRNIPRPRARRYVIPVDVDKQCGEDGNLVSLRNTKATCVKKGTNNFHCGYESLAEVGVEFPTINYDRYNGRKYRYVYGMKIESERKHPFSVLKIDTDTKTYSEWESPNCYPSEPIFIPRPGGTDEDDGVVVTAVNRSDYDEGHKPFLLVLDAKTMEEVGRAEVSDVERFPLDLHGFFMQKQS